MKPELEEFANSFSLSPRERDVLELLTNRVVHFKEIAQHLKVSPSTVNNHFKSIFDKTGTNSKSELLASVLRHVTVKLNHCKHLVRKPQVMVVDDEQGICDVIVEELNLRGMKAYGFSDPAQALAKIASMKLDVIISDLRMPNLDGVEFLREVRKHHHYFPSILFVSGYANRETPDRLMDLGAVALLEKPIDMNKLFSLIMEQFIEDDHERSRYLRMNERIPATVDNQIQLEIGNIGFGGVFIPANKSLEQYKIGSLISFQFSLEDDDAPIQAIGEVVWKRNQAKDNLQPGVGIKFMKVAESDLERIRDHVRMHRILSFIPRGAVSSEVPS